MPETIPHSGFDSTGRLAERILDGEVVFFVGSGFSIDSEGNDAKRLVGRLLAVILAMGTALGDEGCDRFHTVALLDRLCRVFGLDGVERAGDAAREPARCMTDGNVRLLAREYYNFNEWATSALGVLSGELISIAEPRCSKIAGRVQQLATYLLRLVGDPVPLDALNCRVLRKFSGEATRGKALFLDSMGFANPAIMAGDPLEDDVEQVARSYDRLIRPRHHALARLAREGLAGSLVTTNYDLLLEGAYRLAGFVDRKHAHLPDGTPSDRLPRFSTIAGANQFFAQGRGYRTALLLKIHGCALQYRKARQQRIDALALDTRTDAPENAPKIDTLSACLPTLVFTYREIQTWRSDAWSRDLIRTLLRTYTIALCGYSGADPVMHATFREVYDEQATTRASTEGPSDEKNPGNASVFFFGLAGRREFHSLEILRAATIAAGLEVGRLVDHPNHLEFEPSGGFPSLDDHFRWLMHCVVRQLQVDALDTHLRRLPQRIFRRPARDKDLQHIRDRFEELRCLERAASALVLPVAEAAAAPGMVNGDTAARRVEDQRQKFGALTNWTWHFVPGLMRELALADTVASYQGAGRAVRTSRAAIHYQPLSERPEWGSWAVVLELALRSLVAALKGGGTLAPADLAAEDSPSAAISFHAGCRWAPLALCIRLVGFERPDRAAPLRGAFRRVTYWDLHEQDVPWPLHPVDPCPSAEAIWEWAVGEKPPTRDQAVRFLGIES
jgi:hypothetical protein